MTPQGQNVPGCITLVADKWITFDLEADTGGLIPGTNTWDCEIRLYMTVDGVRQRVIDYGKNTRGYTGRNVKAWTGIWLAPYMTDRDSSQAFAETPSVWYREVIVDDKAIDAMTFTPSGQPATSR